MFQIPRLVAEVQGDLEFTDVESSWNFTIGLWHRILHASMQPPFSTATPPAVSRSTWMAVALPTNSPARIPTATDKFYPDFVARLDDDRRMVIGYKGALLAGSGVDDTNEKRTIGRLREKTSGQKGLFLVVEKQIDGKDMRSRLLDKLGA
nr:hypothetical protein [uncultured Rhodopila sp.]